MNIWGALLKLFGWKVNITVNPKDKCVICVAPHTSNLDFILGLAAYRSIGRKANFLMKDFWFFFPLGLILEHLGGIPVKRKKGSGNLTEEVIERFKNSSYMNLAVTPEGTRSRTEKWKTGFLYIAYGADVPVLLGVIDYSRKVVEISKSFNPSGNIKEDMQYVREYYAKYSKAAKYPEKFV